MKTLLIPGQGNIALDLLKVDSPEKKYWYSLIGDRLKKEINENTIADHDVNSAAIVAEAFANYDRYGKHGGTIQAAAGYSIGQYSALAIAGVLERESCLNLVIQRSRLMQRYTDSDTKMLNVIGLKEEVVRSLMREVVGEREPRDDFFLDFACLNSDHNQTVAGPKDLLAKLAESVLRRNARQAVYMPVQGSWHSRRLNPALPEFSRYLDECKFHIPKLGYVDNYTGECVKDPEIIKENLLRHLVSPVLWKKSIQTLIQMKTTAFLEGGAGNQLAKFLFFIDRRIPCFPLHSDEDIKKCAALQD